MQVLNIHSKIDNQPAWSSVQDSNRKIAEQRN